MATPSQVKTALDDVARAIVKGRERMEAAKVSAGEVSAALGALATTYADVVTTVNGYGTSNAFEAAAKAELAKLVAEFGALKTAADGVAATSLG